MKTLTFDDNTGELIIKNPVKRLNKKLILKADLTEYPFDSFDQVKKWTEEGLHIKLTSAEWRAKIDGLKITKAKKGDSFFTSSLYKDQDKLLLYSANTNPEILGKTDRSFGLGITYEVNPFVNWFNYLKRTQSLWEKAEFEEIETEDLTFEQIHLIKLLEDSKSYYKSKISEINAAIQKINNIIL